MPLPPAARGHRPAIAGDEYSAAVRGRLHALLQESARLGTLESGVVIGVVCLFVVLPGHPPIDLAPFVAVLAVTAIGTALVATSVRRRQPDDPMAAGFFFLWGLGDIGAISAGVALSGGARSDLYLLYMVLAVFHGASGFPRRTRLVLHGLSAVGYAATLGALGWHLGAASSVLRFGMLLALSWGVDMVTERLVREFRHQIGQSLDSQRRARLWRAVADLVGTLDPLDDEAVWAWAVGSVAELGYDIAAVHVVEDGGRSHRMVHSVGLPRSFDEGPHPRHAGLCGLVLDRDDTVVVDYATFDRALTSLLEDGLRTTVATPVRTPEGTVAVLVVGYRAVRPPSDEELAALELVAAQAGRTLRRTRTQGAERRAADRVRTILAAAPEAMLVYGADLKVVQANLQAARLFGAEATALVGLPITDLMALPASTALPGTMAAAAPMTTGAGAAFPDGAAPQGAMVGTAPMTTGAGAAFPDGAVPHGAMASAAPMTTGAGMAAGDRSGPAGPPRAEAVSRAHRTEPHVGDPGPPASVPGAGLLFGSPASAPSTSVVRGIRRDGSTFPAELSVAPVDTPDGRLLTATVRDVSERLAYERRLAHHAAHDDLTGLPNRTQFLRRLSDTLAVSGTGPRAAVCFLDVDHFKYVNDSRGHGVGDDLVVQVARRLEERAGGELVARFGGDEFALLGTGITDRDQALAWAWRWLAALDAPFVLDGVETHVSASAGVAFGNAGDSALDVMRRADAAMYRAKQRGRTRVELFDEALTARAAWRLDITSALRHAVARHQLFLEYQPVVALDSAEVVGVEALLRWARPGGLVPPASFVPVAEDSGLILPIGRWVLEEACRQAAAWFADAPDVDGLTLSVNLSSRQLDHDRLIGDVADVLRTTGLAPGSLVLEITESSFIEDLPGAVRRLEALHRLGVQVAIDDFGTGFSSLSSLSRLPIDAVKIDKSFVDGLGTRYDTVIRAVVDVARTFDLRVVAEGVERQSQAAALAAMGCPYAQGFLYARPLPADQAGRAVNLRRCPTSP